MQKNVEQKLDGFKTAIFESIQKTLATSKDNVDRATEEELKTKGDAIRRDAESFMEMRSKKTEDGVREMLADAKLEQNAEALKLRKYMLESTVDALYDRANSYKGSETYKQKLKTDIDTIKDALMRAKSLTLLVSDADKEWVSAHIAQYFSGELNIGKLKKRDIGGAILSLDDAHIRYNMTLRRTIDDSRDAIGAVLFVLLEKMEGSDGE